MSRYSANDQWQHLIALLLQSGFESSPRGLPVIERLACQSRVDMLYPLVTIPERKLSAQFAAAEALWILTGDDRVETIAPWAPSISRFSDDGERFFGAYGPKVIAQLPYVVETLCRDQDSRQAVINIWRENPSESKDIPCTISAQWLIRDGKLYCIDTMRSSDLWLGWPYDVFNFSMISLFIVLLLRQRGLRVRLGSLVLTAGSQHIYRKNLERIKECVAPNYVSEYRPIDVDEFASPQSLLAWLKDRRDRSVSNYVPIRSLQHVP